MAITTQAFQKQLFSTTYQDMANNDWTVTLEVTQPQFTGLAFEDTKGTGTAYYMSFLVPDDATTDLVVGTTGYFYEDNAGNVLKSEAELNTAWAAEMTAGEDYVPGSEEIKTFDISQGFFSREIEMLEPGLEMVWSSTNEKYKPLNQSSCSATFFASLNQAAILDQAVLNAEGNLQVIVEKNNEVFWYGYALPETVASSIDEGKVSYDITFTDGLGMLKNKPWLKDNGEPFTEKISVLNAIATCLKSLPTFHRWQKEGVASHNQTFMEVYGSPQPMRDEAIAPQNENADIFEQVYEGWNWNVDDPMRYISFMPFTMKKLANKVDKTDQQHHGKDSIVNCYNVLEHLLRPFGMELVLFNGHWILYNRTAYLDNASNVRRWQYYYADTASDISTNDAVNDLLGPLSNTGNLKAAYSTRRVVPHYFGPAMRVRNSNSGEEKDIYINEKGFPVAAVTDMGIGDTQVVIWYDQSGQGNHAYVEGYYSGTINYDNCPLIAGNTTGTARLKFPQGTVGGGQPGILFDGVDDFFITPPVIIGDAARTVIASVDLRDPAGGSATENTNNTVYSQPSDDGSNGTAFCLNLHSHTANGYQLNANVFGNAKYDTDSTLWDDTVVAATFPSGGQIQDIQTWQNGTALTQSSTLNGTTSLVTDNNTVRIGTYYLNESTGSYSDFFNGNMMELFLFEEEKDATFISTITQNMQDAVLNADGDNNEETGVYQRNLPLGLDSEYEGNNIDAYGALSKRANKRFNMAARNVSMTHEQQNGAMIMNVGSSAQGFFADSGGWENGYTKMVMESIYSPLYSNGVLETTITHALNEPTNAGDAPYVAPTVEGPKYLPVNGYTANYGNGFSLGLRRSGLWKRESQIAETEYLTGGNDAQNWSLNAGAAPWWWAGWNATRQNYNGRYIGQHPQETTDLNLEAGTEVEFHLSGRLRLEKNVGGGGVSWKDSLSSYFTGCTPVFRGRVEVEDRGGNKWRLFRPVRTYDEWANGGELQYVLDNYAGGGGTGEVEYGEFNAYSNRQTATYTGSTVSSSEVPIYTQQDGVHDNHYTMYSEDYPGTAKLVRRTDSSTVVDVTADELKVRDLKYYAKDMDDSGHDTFGNWIPHPDNTLGTTGSTLAEWEDAWFEVLGMHGDTISEIDGWEAEAQPLQFANKGFAPMYVETSGDGTDELEKLKFKDNEKYRYCYATQKFTVGLPGALGESEIVRMYTETGVEIFHASRGPRPVSADGTYPQGRYARIPVNTDGELTNMAILRSANADGSGGYCQTAPMTGFGKVSRGIEDFGITGFSAKIVGEPGKLSLTSYATGGVGEEAVNLGSTILGTQYGFMQAGNAGRFTSYLMNTDGYIFGAGYWKIKWRAHNDYESLATAQSNGSIFRSLHELTTFSWLKFFGYVRKKLMIDVLPTRDMEVGGPIAPHLPLVQSSLLSAEYGIHSHVMPGRINWSLAKGNRFEGVELAEFAPLRPQIESEEEVGPPVGFESVRPSKRPGVTPNLPVLKTIGSTVFTSGSFNADTTVSNGSINTDRFCGIVNGDWASNPSVDLWADPSTMHEFEFSNGQVKALRAGLYRVDAMAITKPNTFTNNVYLEVHTSPTQNFDPEESTIAAVLFSALSPGTQSFMTYAGTDFISVNENDYIKLVWHTESGDPATSASPPIRYTGPKALRLNIQGANQTVINKPDFGDIAPVAIVR